MQSVPHTRLTGRSLVSLAFLNFFLADARDGLGPFLDGFLATHGWSPMTLGFIATLGGILGMVATPLFGAWVDSSRRKRMLIIVPVVLVNAAALWTLASPGNASVFGGQSATAIVGAVVGPALMGMTLGLVGERHFSRQVSRNEFWNHTGNVVSLAGVYFATLAFGLNGVIGLMIVTAVATVMAVIAIDPGKIDHDVARGLAHDDGAPGPSGYALLAGSKGLILLAVTLMIFHFGNAPISRLIAQDFSIQLGTPFRTTAITTGVSQISMIAMALAAPFLIRRFGLASIFLIALLALPIRGAIAGSFSSFAVIFPVQILDGVGAGLIGIATPIAAERILAGTGRFNVGLGAVMTVQGIGASLSNIVAGWLTNIGGYELAYWVHGGVALLAVLAFCAGKKSIAPAAKNDIGVAVDPAVITPR
ncbi:MFS transporter [Rhizobium brockwellii]|uniref:MFS transporter n=2 Tax=Rhizobium TaxID=379 RepID=A0ABU3YS88_9HYPH|nr:MULTISPECIES: MFS transporter [Rhizobium]KPN22461.1 MFS transporter permease [Rhizobium brockwellii]MDV4156653.1 MFS transporter [Rhizobium brockwellii]MDV4181532.1 MFS transporter [Rhizobium brockwellii]MDV4188679.1 MFS transporter [Rhizobium brockwellii]NZD53215.1 MFS transporter [Rhizobium leguminosarum]